MLTTPLIRRIRLLAPEVHLTVVTTNAGRELLAEDPRVDALIPLDKSWSVAGLRSQARALARVRHVRADVAIAAQRSMRSGLIVRLSGAPTRIGFRGAPGAWAYTHSVTWTLAHHAVHRYLSLSGPLGGDPKQADPRPTLTVTPQALARAERLVDPGSATVVIAPGSARRTKRWIDSGFADVVAAVRERGAVPVLVGSADERELCENIARLAGPPVQVLAGETSVDELVALISRARAVVANDSGAGHVAAALDRPVVSIFGPTSPRDGYAPHGTRVALVEHPHLDCRPCSTHGPRVCPRVHFKCMRELSSAAVIAALHRVLGS